MGVKEQIIFPEIDYDKDRSSAWSGHRDHYHANTDDEGRALLKAFNFPFRN